MGIPTLHIDQEGKDIFLGKSEYKRAKAIEVQLRREGILDASLSIAKTKDLLVNGH